MRATTAPPLCTRAPGRCSSNTCMVPDLLRYRRNEAQLRRSCRCGSSWRVQQEAPPAIPERQRHRDTETARAARREEHGHATDTPADAVCRGADGTTRLWLSGQRVVGPNAAGREFTFITRHRLPDGSSAPVMAPEAVRCALERLGLGPLIPTIVRTPSTSAPSVLLEVVDLGEKGCGVLAGRDVAAGEAVCDYVGEILSTQEAAARQATYDLALRQRETETETETAGDRDAGASSDRRPTTPSPRSRGMNYLLVLLEHLPTRTVRTSVDPTHFGGVAACINHSCAWSSLHFPCTWIRSLLEFRTV